MGVKPALKIQAVSGNLTRLHVLFELGVLPWCSTYTYYYVLLSNRTEHTRVKVLSKEISAS